MTIESTTQIVEANGIQCRVWEGESEHGIKVHVLIPRVAVKNGQDVAQFAKELQEMRAPSLDAIQCFPLRLIL